jgi:hypothetical protein
VRGNPEGFICAIVVAAAVALMCGVIGYTLGQSSVRQEAVHEKAGRFEKDEANGILYFRWGPKP